MLSSLLGDMHEFKNEFLLSLNLSMFYFAQALTLLTNYLLTNYGRTITR